VVCSSAKRLALFGSQFNHGAHFRM
jgi:hypothetical protein